MNKQELGSQAADALDGREPRTLAQSRRLLGACLQLQEEEEEQGKVWQQEKGTDSSSPRLGKRPQASGCLAMAFEGS